MPVTGGRGSGNAGNARRRWSCGGPFSMRSSPKNGESRTLPLVCLASSPSLVVMLSRVRPPKPPILYRVPTLKPRPKPKEKRLQRLLLLPIKWLRNENFYHDLFAGVVSAALVGIAVYVYARRAGYVEPAKDILLAYITISLVICWFGLLPAGALFIRTRFSAPTPTMRRILLLFVLLYMIATLLLGTAL